MYSHIRLHTHTKYAKKYCLQVSNDFKVAMMRKYCVISDKLIVHRLSLSCSWQCQSWEIRGRRFTVKSRVKSHTSP